MYSLNIQKMQTTPNLGNPKTHGKRVRYDDRREREKYERLLSRTGRKAEEGYRSERITTFHPTKGIRTRNKDFFFTTHPLVTLMKTLAKNEIKS